MCSHWPEYNSDSGILSDLIMETIKICRNWYTGSDSDTVQILIGTVPIFLHRKEYLNPTELDSVSVNAPLKYPWCQKKLPTISSDDYQ